MKVVLSSDSYFPLEGGAERQLRHVLERLPEPWEPVVVARGLAGEPDGVVRGHVRVVRVGPAAGGRLGALRYAAAARRVIVRERPDVVVGIQTGASSAAAALAVRRLRPSPPLVVRLTGVVPEGTDLEVQGQSLPRRSVGELVLRSAAVVVAPARYLLDHAGPFQDLVDRRGRIVPNGADAATVPADDPGRTPTVVWIGRDVPPKGLDDFISLAARCPDLQFVAIGPDPERARGLANLRATGWVLDPGAELAGAGLLVSTSRHEGSPNAALEALATGLPVVAFDNAAYRELHEGVGDAVALVPLGDAAALEAAVRAALREPPTVPPIPTVGDAVAEWARLLDEVTAGSVARRPLRIALVTGSLEYGGGETQMVRLAHELDRRGHTVKVFTLLGGGPLGRRVDEYGLERESWDFRGFIVRHPLRTARSYLRAGASLRRFRPDVVHAHLETAYLLSIPQAWLLGVPGRVSARRMPGEGQHYRKGLARRLHRLSIRCSNAIIPNSSTVADSAIEVEHVRPEQLRVIENGVDLPEEVADVSGPDPLGIIVANLRPEKDHAGLIEAFARLPAPPRLRIVGEGPERAHLEKLVADRGLSDRVTFAGFVADAASCFAEAQFSLLVSRFEGLPNAVLESMAHGVPVIGTDIPGIAQLIDDGTDGLLVPPGDPAALAAAIERLASDEALRVRLGAAARARAERYSWDRCADRHVEVYRQILGRRGG